MSTSSPDDPRDTPDGLSPFSFTRRLPARPAGDSNIEANAGIDLARLGDGRLLATPRYLPGLRRGEDFEPRPPLELPRLPGTTLESMSHLLRQAWQSRRACACWALYLHLSGRRWVPYLPPQWADESGCRADLSYRRVEVPGPDLRLAGTCRASATADPGTLAADLLPRDGVHLVWTPDRWCADLAFVTAGGVTAPSPIAGLTHDEPRPDQFALHARLWTVIAG